MVKTFPPQFVSFVCFCCIRSASLISRAPERRKNRMMKIFVIKSAFVPFTSFVLIRVNALLLSPPPVCLRLARSHGSRGSRLKPSRSHFPNRIKQKPDTNSPNAAVQSQRQNKCEPVQRWPRRVGNGDQRIRKQTKQAKSPKTHGQPPQKEMCSGRDRNKYEPRFHKRST